MLLLLQRDGTQPIELLAGKLATSARHVRRLVASLEQIGYVHRSQGVVEMLAAATADSVFYQHVFPVAQLNTPRADLGVRPPDNLGGERGGLLTDPESSPAQEKTKRACASLRLKRGADLGVRGPGERDSEHAAGGDDRLDDEAARIARWLLGQLEGLAWSPAYRVGLAVAEGQWSTAELRRVLRTTLAKRAAGDLHGPAWGYFVTCCQNEIEREGYRWKAG